MHFSKDLTTTQGSKEHVIDRWPFRPLRQAYSYPGLPADWEEATLFIYLGIALSNLQVLM